MDVSEIDVSDDEQVRRFWEAGKEADAFERPYATFWSLLAATVAFRDPHNPFGQHPLVAVDDGEVVGTCQVTLPKLDNTHVALVGLNVRPAHRGRGVGTALLEETLRVAAAHERTTLMCETNLPLEDPPAVGQHFLERRGFTRASTELHRVLELPVANEHLAKLESRAAERQDDYRVQTFGDRVPDEFMDGFCALQMAFNEQAPMGDLDLEPEVWDEDRVRNSEARFEKQDRRKRAAVAIAANGDLVALTEMFTAADNGWQSGTLVLPEHRGHRLGTAIKVANLRQFQAEFPTISMVHSWNAEQNGPMVAINDAMGFRPVEYVVEMQRIL